MKPPSKPQRFHKVAIQGREGNFYKRLDDLESDNRKRGVRDLTNIINQYISENREIILAAVKGTTNDPTDPTFTGIVISPSGQVIGGVLYTFAFVIDGVVFLGMGGDGSPVVVGGGDVFGDTVPSVRDNLVEYSDTTGKHIRDAGIGLDEIILGNDLLYMTDTASPIGGAFEVMSGTFPNGVTATKTVTVNSGDSFQTLAEFASDEWGLPFIVEGGIENLFYLSTSRATDATQVYVYRYIRTSGGVETLQTGVTVIGYTFGVTPTRFYTNLSHIDEATIDPTSRLVIRLKALTTEVSDIDVTLHYNSKTYPSSIRLPIIPPTSGGIPDAPSDTYMYGRKDAAWESLQIADVGADGDGVDVCVNGGFDTDTDWTKGAGWDITGGQAVGTATDDNLTAEVPPLIVGHWYYVQFDLTVTVGSINAGFGTKQGSGTIIGLMYASTDAFEFLASTFTGTIDNVQIINLGLTLVLSLFADKISDQTIQGLNIFSQFPLTPSAAPTTDYQVANKKYVDDNAGTYTDEMAQDAVGGMVADTTTIDLTYTDATPALTADVKDGSITYAKMQDVSATNCVLGRITALAGDVEELTGANIRTIANVADGAQVNVLEGVSGTAPIVAGAIAAKSQAISISAASAGGAGSMSAADFSKLAGIEAAADVTDATNVDAAGAVMNSDYDANTILAANSDNTPAALTLAANTFPARSSAGNIAAKR